MNHSAAFSRPKKSNFSTFFTHLIIALFIFHLFYFISPIYPYAFILYFSSILSCYFIMLILGVSISTLAVSFYRVSILFSISALLSFHSLSLLLIFPNSLSLLFYQFILHLCSFILNICSFILLFSISLF